MKEYPTTKNCARRTITSWLKFFNYLSWKFYLGSMNSLICHRQVPGTSVMWGDERVKKLCYLRLFSIFKGLTLKDLPPLLKHRGCGLNQCRRGGGGGGCIAKWSGQCRDGAIQQKVGCQKSSSIIYLPVFISPQPRERCSMWTNKNKVFALFNTDSSSPK